VFGGEGKSENKNNLHPSYYLGIKKKRKKNEATTSKWFHFSK
jgi:hypothetical protein